MGMPVHLEMTWAISSASTSSVSIFVSFCREPSFSVDSASFFSRSIRTPYLIFAASSRFPSRSAFFSRVLFCSILALVSPIALMISFPKASGL